MHSQFWNKTRKILLLFSFLLFPITMNWFSPYLPIAGAVEGIIAGSMIVFGMLFVSSLFVGRLFCGWLCPMGGLQDVCTTIREKRVTQGWVQLLKWFIWVPWFGFFLALLTKVEGSIGVTPLFMFENGISVDSIPGLIRYLAVVLLVIIIAFSGGKRAFCHSACWIAPFMIVGQKVGRVLRLPQLHLQTKQSDCTNCDRCTKVCPMSLEVKELVQGGAIRHRDCVLCGECERVCHKQVIGYTVNRK